ncbi:STAS domain-containing protein [Nocardioides panaciterrulae]|uniref:Anti-sigma factor antagonist n=1 Tax=Nocardioides panaciterrulae TaxID=661492 RepID=A0A7Y9JAV7_9ACTN|nr:STAS domain-containing protein [Nocardioides panaciterrulae]NYD42142.1 anti-anti-sigma factor [Nocardioides panaciterrulae]
MQFSLQSTVTPPDVTLELSGELDIFTADQVSREVDRALWSGCRRALLDTSEVTFVDASALGVLARARDLMRSCAGTMEIVSFSPVVLRLCLLTGLSSLLSDPPKAAVAS